MFTTPPILRAINYTKIPVGVEGRKDITRNLLEDIRAEQHFGYRLSSATQEILRLPATGCCKYGLKASASSNVSIIVALSQKLMQIEQIESGKSLCAVLTENFWIRINDALMVNLLLFLSKPSHTKGHWGCPSPGRFAYIERRNRQEISWPERRHT